MQFSTIFVALAAYTTFASAARIQFYKAKQCSGGSSEDYQNVQCNTCVDPPFGLSVPHLYSMLLRRPHASSIL